MLLVGLDRLAVCMGGGRKTGENYTVISLYVHPIWIIVVLNGQFYKLIRA